MFIPTKAIHRAAAAMQSTGDVTQAQFEDEYHCKVGLMSPDVVNYYDIYFDTEEYASMFLLRWM
jgi:hypothetical protein